MATIPAAVALRNIADSGDIIASDHRNNYSDVQVFINELRTILAGGVSGQFLQSGGASAIQWAASGPGDPVTTLPVSPADQQQALLVDSLTAPTYAWLFQYEAGISDANKWVCVGAASPLSAENNAASSSVSTTYVDPTNNVTVTVPRGGIYEVEFGGYHDMFAAETGYVAVKRGAAASSDADALLVRQAGVTSFRMIRMTLAASDVLKLQIRTSNASAGINVEKLALKVRPVRVA